MQINFTNKKLDDLDSFCKQISNEIVKLFDSKNTLIFLLETSMGSGKTTFIRTLLQCFDKTIRVSSPTFTGMHQYSIHDIEIFHYDLYQVALSVEEFDDILKEDGKKMIFFEWSQNLPPHLHKSFDPDDVEIIKCT